MNTEREVICGFEVSEKRKKVWAAELEMVKAFIDICDKNGLKYFAASGTLLGAVRHNGFIPWDDDIDLLMPRDDYERFLAIGQSFLPDGMFLQCNKTETRYPTGHAQIRNGNTACLRLGEIDRLKRGGGQYNYGIFIDIFPYDDVSADSNVRKKQADKIKRLRKMCSMKVYPYSDSFIKRAIKKIVSGVYFMFHSLERRIEEINTTAMLPVADPEYVGATSFAPGYEKNIWKKELFDEAVLHDFEDIKIAIPKRYEEVLAHEYGDYMKLPENTAGSMHGECYFDTERSYKEYAQLSCAELRDICSHCEL